MKHPIPLNASVQRLPRLTKTNFSQTEMTDPNRTTVHGVEACDLCCCDLEKVGLFVDGILRGEPLWANMCPECFAGLGEGLAHGSGQLYARQEGGTWQLIAGACSVDGPS